MSVSYIKEVKDWIRENNSSISNIKSLLHSRIDINKIFEKENLDVKKNYTRYSREWCILRTKKKLERYAKKLEEGKLITEKLYEIRADIDNYLYDNIQEFNSVNLYNQFKFRDYQEELSDFIKQNTNWRNKEKDFNIYLAIKNGVLYSELADKYECDISTISKINSKVQSSINNLKGKFFEIEYEKYLKSLNKFQNSKIVRDGNPGKPDIYIIDNIENELHIFSLKNLELNKKSFCIIKEQLKPELKFAYYNYTFEIFNNVGFY